MTMPDTEDYIVFDRTGTPHVVVAVKAEIGGNRQQSGNPTPEQQKRYSGLLEEE